MKVVEQFKRRILDLAICGKLVPQDPNDEPASVLLERIKAEKAKLVKAGKIKKEKNPSEIVIGSDGAAYEKFGSGGVFNAEAQRRRVDVPFDLPQGWAWARLESILRSLHTGLNPRRFFQLNTPDALNYYITIRELKNNTIVVSNRTDRINDKAMLLCNKRSDLEKGDVLFGGTGTIGVCALISEHPSNWNIKEGVYALKPFKDGLSSKYLLYLLQSESIRKEYLSKAVGATILSVPMKEVASTMIPVPPLAEQKRIVNKIEKLFAIADSLGAAADGLENAAKRLGKKILDLAIRGKLVPQDPNDEPARELVKRIAASHKSPSKNHDAHIDPPFAIPQSWEWVRLKNLGVFCGGHTPSTSNPNLWGGDMLWVSSKDMKSKYIDDTQMKVTQLGAEELNVLKPGTLLMCTRSGILRRVFPVAIARRELTINQDQRALTLWLPEMIEYVYLALKSLESIILSDYKKSGTTVESIIWNKFVDLPIPLPPLNEQKRIVKRVDEFKALTRMFATS